MGSRHTKREQRLWDQVTVAALSAPWFAGTLNELHKEAATGSLEIHALAALIADGVILARRARRDGGAPSGHEAPYSVPPAAPWAVEVAQCVGRVGEEAEPDSCVVESTAVGTLEIALEAAPLVPEEPVAIVERAVVEQVSASTAYDEETI